MQKLAPVAFLLIVVLLLASTMRASKKETPSCAVAERGGMVNGSLANGPQK